MAKTTKQSTNTGGRRRPSAPPVSYNGNRRRYDGGGKVK